MQKMTFLLLLACFFSQVLPVVAQEDPTLFTVGKMEVPRSEFQYIYTKNNRDNADYSRASVSEYLDLYTRFKLKVMRARELQLDTITALNKELEGYRMQLAKSYLNDKEVVDKLTREAYDRMQWDIRVAHILVKHVPNASPEEQARMQEKALNAAKRAKAGEDFAALAKELSEDQNTAANGGELGYVAAMLPSGFYNVENAVYRLRDGEVSDPVNSSLGIHVFKVLGRRPARGEVEAAHIFVRVKADGTNEDNAKQKINALHQNLKDGKSFEELATSVSDDQQTAKRGGYIGRFGINSYDPAFEDAVFGLTEPGSFTEPVRTRVGWHIIKLINKPQPASYDEEKVRLEGKVARDERVSVAKAAMIETIKRESGLTEYPQARNAFVDSLKEDFFTFQWTIPESRPVTIIRFGDGTEKTTHDFGQYMRTKTRERMRAAKTSTPQAIANTMYKEWVDELCLSYEESKLEQKYPDFRALMREYEEGILLFEVTKTMVWDKASQDSAGLAAFHAMHREDYMWPERAEVNMITVEGPQAAKVAIKARKLLAKHAIEQVALKLNKKQQQISFQRKRYTTDELANAGLKWEKGWISETTADPETGAQRFTIVSNLLSPEPKALSEARGYVIADYQDYLEKEWVEELRQMYPVKVDQAVLNTLIKP